MGSLYPVLRTENTPDGYRLIIKDIDEDTIPEIMNGENGFHIFHVRALSELILRQLQKTDNTYSLTEDDICAMSVASSLHDIGKTRIPKSILEFPGKLSPLEYDIVKKHAALGEEIISGIPSDIDPKIIKYACHIAKSHHERYDGNGYPEGLKGDDIPLCAQVVSLADAFDALTSSRSYKKAFSQDVAIEMISNGMCGIFNPMLIECLLQVVNNKELVAIREKLGKKRSTISGQDIFDPKRVLFIGNTAYITEDFIAESFYNSNIVIVGKSPLKSRNGLKVYNCKAPAIDSLFTTYDFDLIVYFSSELTYDFAGKSDAEELREILRRARELQKDVRFLYLSSLDGAFEGKSDRSLLVRSKENLCEHYRDEFSVDIKIIRIPYLYSSTNKDDFLYRIFEQMENNNVVKINEVAAARCYFLSPWDLPELLVRFTDNWKSGIGILTVNDEFNFTFSDFAQKLKSLKDGVKIDFTQSHSGRMLSTHNKAVRNEYGWFSKISLLQDLQEQYENYLASKSGISLTLLEKIKEWIGAHRLASQLIELFGLFFLTEILIALTDSAVFFSIVDFRMAFIVIMATVHGLNFGIASAFLSSVSWFFAKVASGTHPLTIFYEPTNWLAFVFFFLIGGLCGYVRLKADDKEKELCEQNSLLEDKLIFTRELYTDTFNEKRALKKQIISSKDSFGKIFDVTRQLDTVEPRKLYLRIMDTFEDILENKSISVYSITENSAFGRLEVASRDIMAEAARSISLESYKELIEDVTANKVWRNTSLKHSLPMYAAGVSRKGKLELLIFVWQAGNSQRSLYYVNLFKILCDLVQMSLLRAYDFSQATLSEQYIENTHILNAKAYEKAYENFKDMADRKVFSFVHMKSSARGRSLQEIDKLLSSKIRANDVIGTDEKGDIHILLSQATNEDLKFVLPRFENTGIEITVF